MRRIIEGDQDYIDGIKVVQENDEILEELLKGNTVLHWEFGDSMSPLIRNTEYCKIAPCNPIDIHEGDAVFCDIEYEGHAYLMVHMVGKISTASHEGCRWFQIVSTNGTIFGWTRNVYGKAVGTDIFQNARYEDYFPNEEER